MRRKTKKDIDDNVRFLRVPEWKQVYTYHRTNKKSRQTDINGKR